MFGETIEKIIFGAESDLLWMDKILHQIETIGNHCFLLFTGELSFPGFLGGAKWTSQPSTVWSFEHFHPEGSEADFEPHKQRFQLTQAWPPPWVAVLETDPPHTSSRSALTPSLISTLPLSLLSFLYLFSISCQPFLRAFLAGQQELGKGQERRDEGIEERDRGKGL